MNVEYAAHTELRDWVIDLTQEADETFPRYDSLERAATDALMALNRQICIDLTGEFEAALTLPEPPEQILAVPTAGQMKLAA